MNPQRVGRPSDGRFLPRAMQSWLGLLPVLLLLAAGCATHPRPSPLNRFEFEAIEMAIPFRIVVYSADSQVATNAARQAFARIHGLNGQLSDYDPESELSRFSRTAGTGQSVPLSTELAAVLVRAQEVARESDGAFDVTVGPLVQLWRRARRQREIPDPARLGEARAAVGWGQLELRRTHGAAAAQFPFTGRLLKPGMRLDLGGIAKGYALDEATRILRAHGLHRTLITGAGDMVAGDPPPGQPGWKIDLPPVEFPGSPPDQAVWLRRGALCTSGDLFQYVEIDGQRYSHIVDPHTGLGLTDRGLVIVLGRDGMTTDALSTALSVLPTNQGLAVARKYRVEARILRVPKGTLEANQTPNFPR